MSATENPRVDSLKALALLMMEEVAKLEALPSDDDFDIGDVVWWRRRFPPNETQYTYCAVKFAPGLWAASSRYGREAETWDRLSELFISGNVDELWFATAWQQIELP